MSGAVRGRLRERGAAARELLRLIGLGGRRAVAGLTALHVVAGALPIAFMIGIGLSLDALSRVPDAARPGRDVLVPLALALTAFLLQQTLAPAQLTASRTLALRVDAYCSARIVHRALTRMPLRALESTAVADELHEATETLALDRMTPGAAAEGALALVARYTQLLGALLVLLWAAGPLVAGLAAVVALVSRFGQTEAFHRWGTVIVGLGPARRRTAYIRDLGLGTAAAKEIRTLGLGEWLADRHRAEAEATHAVLWRDRRRIYGRPFVVYAALGAVGAVAALVVLAGQASPSVVALTVAVQAAMLCVRFGVMFPESDVKLVYGRAAWEAMNRADELAAAFRPDVTGTLPAPGPERDVVLDGVRFGYRTGAEAEVLRGLDLRLEAGRSHALVGVNGAGKTTFVKLLTGLYRPLAGTVRVDGTDLAEIDADSWQSRFAVTFQDFVRYELSLRENVAMNAIEHLDDDAGITAALERAGLGDLAPTLAEGLETPLARALPGGRDLSGGQWQRVALARSLFAVSHGARILVLDEPTAQLDARGEAAFYDTFLDLTRGVTTLVISHRFSTVRRADRIFVLDGGRITESGSHDELLAVEGEYARMFTAQARRFRQDPVTAGEGA